jgi:hypothetical protein
MMPRPPQCDNDNCDYDETGWHHAPECPADADNGDTPWGSNPHWTPPAKTASPAYSSPARRRRGGPPRDRPAHRRPVRAAALFVTGVAIASTRISRKGDRS